MLALHSPTDFQNPPKSDALSAEDLRDSHGLGRTPTDFRTIEIERLGFQDPSANPGVDQIPGQLKLNDCRTIEKPLEPTVLQGGQLAMEAASVTLAKAIADALEAGNWEVAEQLSAQLQRVLAIRTQSKKKGSQP